MSFVLKFKKKFYKLNLKIINKIYSLLVNNNSSSSYCIHYTSVLKHSEYLCVKNGNKNYSVMKSLNNSICCYLNCANGLYFGEGVLFGPNVSFISSNHDTINRREAIINENDNIVIEDNVWIGSHVVILPGVIIGENSIIGAGSVVTKNIPKNTLAVGNPAIAIKNIT